MVQSKKDYSARPVKVKEYTRVIVFSTVALRRSQEKVTMGVFVNDSVDADQSLSACLHAEGSYSS